MINFHYIAKDNIKEHNPNWLQIPNSFKILITGSSESRKTNALFNLRGRQREIDKFF